MMPSLKRKCKTASQWCMSVFTISQVCMLQTLNTFNRDDFISKTLHWDENIFLLLQPFWTYHHVNRIFFYNLAFTHGSVPLSPNKNKKIWHGQHGLCLEPKITANRLNWGQILHYGSCFHFYHSNALKHRHKDVKLNPNYCNNYLHEGS